jgi:hypothetical protein
MNLRQKIFARDTACWHCGTQDGLVLHHRANRGMGGSKAQDQAANLILVCQAYNFAMESDPKVAELARERGHKLSRYTGYDTPILDVPQGIWFILTNDGGKVRSKPLHFRN